VRRVLKTQAYSPHVRIFKCFKESAGQKMARHNLETWPTVLLVFLMKRENEEEGRKRGGRRVGSIIKL